MRIRNCWSQQKETCALFGISTNTLYVWEKQLSEQGHLERKKRVAKSRKIPLEQLEAYVQQHPDAFFTRTSRTFQLSYLLCLGSPQTARYHFKKRRQLIVNKIKRK
ncbi:IS630 transposase-related protein [Streptococcus sp. O1]|uniref:IS630 transposase-related protein n=1 Tax=Streptococcus sp. O1 TaxID=2928735 RepID=UPI00358FB09E